MIISSAKRELPGEPRGVFDQSAKSNNSTSHQSEEFGYYR